MNSTTAVNIFKTPPLLDEDRIWEKKISLAFGIRPILFASLFLIAAVPVSLLSAWVERSAIEKEILSVSEKHLIVAQNLSGALSRYATDVKLFFSFFAQDESPVPLHRNHRMGLKNLHLNYIATLGPDGEVLSEINADPAKAITLPEKKLLDQLRGVAMAAGGAVTISGIKKFLGSPHFFVLKVLPSGNLALAPLDPSYIVNIQKSIAFGERGHSMVVDHQGRVVAHPNPKWQATSKNASKLSVVKKMITGNTGVMQFYSPPMKADMIAGYTYVPETGWGVMVPQPMSELIENAHGVQSVALVIAAAEILVAGLLSWWLSSLLARPVLAVVQAARKVSDGNFDAHVEDMPAHAPAEMKILGGTFNTMIDELQLKTRALSESLERAEEGSRTKSQFLAMMSHEIRTPMNGILGVLELLDDTTLDDEQKSYVSVARNSGTSLVQIINDILDFSTLEAGKLKIHPQPFDVRETVDEVIHLFRPIADDKSIKIEVMTAEAVPATLVADSQRIRQILFNLLGNAVKFTDEGEVAIQSEYTEERAGEGLLKIIVHDTGIGIPKDKQDQLFEDFAQCDASYSRKYGGTGLGLAISMRLVGLMEGTIDFISAPGEGSSFWITIPVTKEQV
ncbi:MAG: Cache 3/Cache 2 fusion domain-containing protein [Rhodospirillales bacterium]|nr:Cache 3/Cache 2 fusion domain-containing protein [Rhodospirillales bacterium]